MDELRELRVYMLGVACAACLLSIGMTLADNINFRSYVICAENALYELVSLWLSFWS